jgi:hypothetical protein
MATEIIGTILLFSTIMVFIVSYFKTRHNERMALINSGRTAKIFDTNDTESNKSLKFGLFLLSIGLGLLTGLIIDKILETEPAGVFVSIFIFGGISLIFYHLYVEGKNKKVMLKDNIEDDIV